MSKYRWCTKLVKSQKGQAFVEFALVAPIFFLLLFSMIDISRLFYAKFILCYTCADTARSASVGTALSNIQANLASSVSSLVSNSTVSSQRGVDSDKNNCTQVTVTSKSGSAVCSTITPVYTNTLSSGNQLKISISYKFQFITPVKTMLGNTLNISETYYSRVETPPK